VEIAKSCELHGRCILAVSIVWQPLDADLQRVIAAWAGLPVAIRKALLALVVSQ
jgi:hypothetical protein